MDHIANTHENQERSWPGLAGELIEGARWLHGLGWSIIPIGPEKKPAVKKWGPYQRRPMPLQSLTTTIGSPKVVGIAVVLGGVSGSLMVRDFDSAEGYRSWAERHPSLASSLPTVRTGKGFHVYARSASPVASRAFHRGGEAEPGELRGEGCYVVTAPSLHASGIRYAWAIPPGGGIPIVDPALLAPLGYTLPATYSDNCNNTALPYKSSSSCTAGGSDSSEREKDLAPVDADIRRSMPGRVGERNSRLFEFLRRIKARQPAASFDEIEGDVRRWHEAAYPVIGTKDLATTLADARDGWRKIREPKGEKLRQAIDEARARPIPDDLSPREGLLLNLCGRLAALHDQGGRFFLGCSAAAQALGISDSKSAWRVLIALKDRKLIRSEEPGSIKGMKAEVFSLAPEGRRRLGITPNAL